MLPSTRFDPFGLTSDNREASVSKVTTQRLTWATVVVRRLYMREHPDLIPPRFLLSEADLAIQWQLHPTFDPFSMLPTHDLDPV